MGFFFSPHSYSLSYFHFQCLFSLRLYLLLLGVEFQLVSQKSHWSKLGPSAPSCSDFPFEFFSVCVVFGSAPLSPFVFPHISASRGIYESSQRQLEKRHFQTGSLSSFLLSLMKRGSGGKKCLHVKLERSDQPSE